MGRKRIVQANAAIAYTRVSTDEQSLGPAAQRKAIEGWAQRESIVILAWYHEDVSGGADLDERGGLLDAINDLRERRAGILIAAKRDRFARERLVIAMVERDVERLGARLRTADGTNDDSPEAVLMRQLLDAFAVYERALIRARTRAALKAKRARGERAGSLPYGFELDPDSRCDPETGRPQGLQPQTDEQATIAEARRLKKAGLTIREIADELNRQHRPSRGSKWDPPKVWRMLQANPPARPDDGRETPGFLSPLGEDEKAPRESARAARGRTRTGATRRSQRA